MRGLNTVALNPSQCNLKTNYKVWRFIGNRLDRYCYFDVQSSSKGFKSISIFININFKAPGCDVQLKSIIEYYLFFHREIIHDANHVMLPFICVLQNISVCLWKSFIGDHSYISHIFHNTRLSGVCFTDVADAMFRDKRCKTSVTFACTWAKRTRICICFWISFKILVWTFHVPTVHFDWDKKIKNDCSMEHVVDTRAYVGKHKHTSGMNVLNFIIRNFDTYFCHCTVIAFYSVSLFNVFALLKFCAFICELWHTDTYLHIFFQLYDSRVQTENNSLLVNYLRGNLVRENGKPLEILSKSNVLGLHFTSLSSGYGIGKYGFDGTITAGEDEKLNDNTQIILQK